MFEIIDTAVTGALTAMIYGVPVLVTIAFVHFVVTHPAPQKESPVPAPAQKQQLPAADQPPVIQPVESSAVAVEDLSEPAVAAIECVPVNWKLWKVADLRDKTIKKALNIQDEQNSRKLKKQALIDRYKAAFARRLGCQPVDSTEATNH